MLRQDAEGVGVDGVDGDEVDFTGLMESMVDSDEEDLAESIDVIILLLLFF